MPTWQPNWIDVRFDHLAASEAVDGLYSAARQLHDQLDRRTRQVDRAEIQWCGARRDDWIDTHDRLSAEHAALEATLRADAKAIEGAMWAALQEQRSREEGRSVWFAQRTEEQRAMNSWSAGMIRSGQGWGEVQAPMAW